MYTCISSAKLSTIFNLTCSASSQITDTSGCEHALVATNWAWTSHNEGTSAWIQVQMANQKYVTKLEMMWKCTAYPDRQAKKVNLEFEDGTKQAVITV